MYTSRCASRQEATGSPEEVHRDAHRDVHITLINPKPCESGSVNTLPHISKNEPLITLSTATSALEFHQPPSTAPYSPSPNPPPPNPKNKKSLFSTNPLTPPSHQPTTLQLLSWGRGVSGQLGGGIEEIRLYPSPFASLQVSPSFRLASPIPGRLSNSPPPLPSKNYGEEVEVGICCGLFHCALVVNEEVWMWGKGDGGRLGFGHENSVFEPTMNQNLEDIKCVSLGGLHSAALTTGGQVFTWGYGGFGALGHTVYTRELTPRLVEGSWEEEICHISTSGTHTAAITRSGELYTWGREEGEGRLGLGPGRGPDQAGGVSIPYKVVALPVPVAAVSCGGFFTMALTEEGQLWNWGANSNYELGRGDKIGGWKPQVVPSLKDVQILQVASGGYHSLALTDEGRVFSWGHGAQGQLGHSSFQSQKVPTLIEALADENVIYIACGGSSGAAVTEKGKLYMWGNSKDNQLGVPGLPELQPSPVEVNFLMDDDGLGDHKVLQIAVGASHAMCLVSRSSSPN